MFTQNFNLDKSAYPNVKKSKKKKKKAAISVPRME